MKVNQYARDLGKTPANYAPLTPLSFLERAASFNPQRTSVMFDYTPSEFSRIRLQYARSQTLPGMADNEWFLQYILSLGAHGAHKY